LFQCLNAVFNCFVGFTSIVGERSMKCSSRVPERFARVSVATLSGLALASLLVSCKTPQGDSAVRSGDQLAMGGSPSMGLFEQGFSLSRTDGCREGVPESGTSSEAGGVGCQTQASTDAGYVIARRSGSGPGESALAVSTDRAGQDMRGFALDRGRTAEGDVVFKWPSARETIDRDYDRLSELMTEYSKLVGTMLKRAPEGRGEEAWASWIRSDQSRRCEARRTSGSIAWCEEVVTQLVDRFVPSGSTYRQYGNCGEGGRIGACLAKRAGFKDNEIRLCLSQNDHFFAMVWRGKEESTGVDHKWCILDRWDLIGHFSCGVDVDTSRRVVTKNGRAQSNEWLNKVKCDTLENYVSRGYGVLR